MAIRPLGRDDASGCLREQWLSRLDEVIESGTRPSILLASLYRFWPQCLHVSLTGRFLRRLTSHCVVKSHSFA